MSSHLENPLKGTHTTPSATRPHHTRGGPATQTTRQLATHEDPAAFTGCRIKPHNDHEWDGGEFRGKACRAGHARYVIPRTASVLRTRLMNLCSRSWEDIPSCPVRSFPFPTKPPPVPDLPPSYVKNTFDPASASTIGASFLAKKVAVDDCLVRLQVRTPEKSPPLSPFVSNTPRFGTQLGKSATGRSASSTTAPPTAESCATT